MGEMDLVQKASAGPLPKPYQLVRVATNSSTPNRKMPAPPIRKWGVAAATSEFVRANIQPQKMPGMNAARANP